jgi:hypothetical protein
MRITDMFLAGKSGKGLYNPRILAHYPTQMARTKSSAEWLSRHLNDPFVKQAQKDGYRAR